MSGLPKWRTGGDRVLTWKAVWVEQERFKDMQRQAQAERLLRQLPEGSGASHRFFDRVLAWLGRRPVAFTLPASGPGRGRGEVTPRHPVEENHPEQSASLQEVAYCGLYCGLCASRRRIPHQAAKLRETLCREGYDQGYFDVPCLEKVFAAFWEGLNRLADSPCPGCRSGGGDPACAVRACAQERKVTVCPLCLDYPCQRLEALHRYPLLPADSRRLRCAGLERWIAEQEARAATGFAYADVRLPEETAIREIGCDGLAVQR